MQLYETEHSSLKAFQSWAPNTCTVIYSVAEDKTSFARLYMYRIREHEEIKIAPVSTF